MMRHDLLCFLFVFISGTICAQDNVVRVVKGKLTSPILGEVSGMLPSERYSSSIWVHNDSGDKAHVYLIDSLANLKGTVELEGIHSVDMEDIAGVEIEGEFHLVLADIGDNRGERAAIYLYIFKEPEGLRRNEVIEVPRADIRVCTLQYPGHPRDAEAIFIDPLAKTFFLISKREFRSTVYTASIFDNSSISSYRLQPQVQLPFTFVTAADISRQRDALIIKNLTSIYHWTLSSDDSILTALRRPATQLSYQAEPQGEALAFDASGTGFFTLSERPLGLSAYLYYYTFRINSNSL